MDGMWLGWYIHWPLYLSLSLAVYPSILLLFFHFGLGWLSYLYSSEMRSYDCTLFVSAVICHNFLRLCSICRRTPRGLEGVRQKGRTKWGVKTPEKPTQSEFWLVWLEFTVSSKQVILSAPTSRWVGIKSNFPWFTRHTTLTLCPSSPTRALGGIAARHQWFFALDKEKRKGHLMAQQSRMYLTEIKHCQG